LDPNYIRALPRAVDVASRAEATSLVSKFLIASGLVRYLPADSISEIKNLFGNSEGQLLQDLFCAIALHQKTNGFFVEVGVGSGKLISNTYMLEKTLNWEGILIEPNKSSHSSIRECRSVALETRAAASSSGQKLRFEEFVGAGEFSRISNTGGHDIEGVEINEYTVETITLNDVFEKMDAPLEMDYLSLDTEGSEIDILRGLDMEKYTFKVLTIEHNHSRHVLETLNEMLTPYGYVRVFPELSNFDAWYLHRSALDQSPFNFLINS